MTKYSKDENNSKVVDQIKKLLALAGSPNEHEAKLAMQRAQELMLKYNLSTGAINEYETRIIDVYPNMTECYPQGFVVSMAFDKWEPVIFSCITTLFGCFVLMYPGTIDGKRYRIFGFPTNVDLALYTYQVILTQAHADFRKGYKEYRSIAFPEGFWSGFAIAIGDKFAAERKKALEMDLYKGIMDKCNAMSTGKLSKFNVESTVGYRDGIDSGTNVELRPGVGGSSVKGYLK